MTDWQAEWLTEWLTDWLTDRLSQWLTDGLSVCLSVWYVSSHIPGSRQNVCLQVEQTSLNLRTGYQKISSSEVNSSRKPCFKRHYHSGMLVPASCAHVLLSSLLVSTFSAIHNTEQRCRKEDSVPGCRSIAKTTGFAYWKDAIPNINTRFCYSENHYF